MRLPGRRTGLSALACAIALIPVLALATPASAAPVAVPFDCQGRPPVGSPEQFLLTASVEADAPATVAAGAAFDVNLAPDPMTVPAEVGGYSVNRVRDLVLKVPVPAGSTFISARLSGGENLGPGVPRVSQADNIVTVTVPGPIAGGATFRLPALHLSLTASGAAGTAITTKVAGTSYDDPGLSLVANVRVVVLPIDVPALCFANPSPILTTTTIQ